ncbi:type II CRISPR RNA-guided endonuclease Cas9 [Tamlana fucoidanivorans]|uniref:CRISPR-associated endonuclease Cas9 n=1 Tax=Allotamlana fucoidanivorans TaxID=2583814 RepID=A0A5C4ST35_9FLAO|nr:type II CRISPR RNA-guided endonuclease Cas9 [Tamlana fucoidanivorans]TNJ47167.1 type II CRISPR RNA-guided endonuclease Cas9 [Tamlana fucoidanivorans]
MKKILGLDLGTTSIGWALVNEAENNNETSEIIKLGVRVNPLTVDEKTNFEKGRPLSTNADRTLKRSTRRNLQRYKLRRKNLIEILIKNGFINHETPLTEIGKNTTHQTLQLRALATKTEISIEDLARVFLMINKKRGYKSSRKANNEEEGQAIDGMAVAKTLYENNQTPGQYVLQLLKDNRKYIPDFYRSDLQNEFDNVWEHQKKYYPTILTDALYKELQGKNKGATWAICQTPFSIEGIKLEGNATEQKLKRYQLRSDALHQQISLEHFAIVLQEINNNLNQSSGYLGAISDRSKELFFNNETVGENLYNQLLNNPHQSLTNQVFYRQDYLDEFERIWETQAKFHSELTEKLKTEIRDVIIFYQRKLKSQKGLLSFCQFESWEQTYTEKESGKQKKRTVGNRVISKSSPLFQEFKIWQNINNLQFKRIDGKTNDLFNQDIENDYVLDEEIKLLLFEELNVRGDLKANEVLKFLGKKPKEWKCNFEKIEGNRTNKALFDIYQKIADYEGFGHDWNKKTAIEIKEELKAIFPQTGIDASILDFNAELEGAAFDKQSSYQLWHLLYSAEDDSKITEDDKNLYGNSNVALKKKLHTKYGFAPKYANLLCNIKLQDDYGNLSSKAIRKIIPYLKAGHIYSEACKMASYNHSNSETVEERAKKVYADKLELVKKNSLRNPVVEKILNQMINVINQVIDSYGKPNEVRIELARELKKNADERREMTVNIAAATRRNEDIKKSITKEFGIPNPTKNDVIRYRLWLELEQRGYKSLFTNTYIPKEKLFSKEIDVEHIIPKALLFDDSFSNKTLAYRHINLKKADRTAYDFISDEYQSDLENYIERVESLYNKGKGSISKAKRNKLLMPLSKLPDGFIERDLRNSQYIAKKARQLLLEVFPEVIPTSGNITDKLREDWDLINVMKELNFPKYKALGLTAFEERLDKSTEKLKQVEVIKDWTKRNDHRHHAMDALTVAFTSHNHIQYLNNLSASRNEQSELYGIRNKITYKNEEGKRKFIKPMNNFRGEAKKHIESVLVSHKAKNKVVTKNINKSKLKGKNKYQTKIQLTPRGQLHKETVYGKSKQTLSKATKLNKKFTIKDARLIIDKRQRELVLQHLKNFNNNPDVAFDTNTLKQNLILFNENPLKEVLCFEEIFTIRKDINPENFKDVKTINKVVDLKVRQILLDRLSKYNGKPKDAFSDLEKNPIWLNKAKGISIKRVTIIGVSNAEPLHHKKDHLGKELLDDLGNRQATDFVSTGNNHHVAIYKDANGKLHEKVVSFYEAVARVNEDLPVINKTLNEHFGWTFQFTMKQNEMFVFPSKDFDPKEINLLDKNNFNLISQHLFRVQKIATKNYMFTHHLETQATNGDDLKKLKMLSGKKYHFIQTPEKLDRIIKVRINHIGQIVQIGEY